MIHPIMPRRALCALHRIGLLLGAAAASACSESITVSPAISVSLAIESGQGVTTAVGTSATPTPTVRVTDATGAPVAGARLVFAVTRGKGSVSPSQVTTGADGRAAVAFWQYGTAVGPQQLTAAVVSSTSDARVVLNGSAVAGPTASLAVIPSLFSLEIGQTRQLSVNAVDRFGNPTGSAVAATFTSGNTNIATVTSGGLVTAVGYGAATITAVYDGVTVRATVGVGTRPAGDSITLTSFGSRPYSVAVAQQNTLYAVRVDAADFARANLPNASLASTHALVGAAYDLTFLPDGSTAYFANTPNNVVSVVTRSTNSVLRTIGGLGEPYRIRASPTGSHVYLTTSQGNLHRITVGSDAVSSLALSGPLNGLAIDRDGSFLYATNYNGQLFEVSLATFTVTRTLTLNGFPQGIAIAPDARTLYVANEALGVHVIDLASFTITTTLGLTGAFDVLVTIDGQELYVSRPVSGVNGGTVTVVGLATLSALRSIDGGTPRRMALSADATTVIIANEAGYLTIVR